MIENIRLLKNKIRIWFLSVFTSRVKHIVIQDQDGKEHKVTVEKQLEKVCDHKQIEEIAPTMWKCTRCPDVYFQISYKVMLTERNLVDFLSAIADHLKFNVTEKPDAEL